MIALAVVPLKRIVDLVRLVAATNHRLEHSHEEQFELE